MDALVEYGLVALHKILRRKRSPLSSLGRPGFPDLRRSVLSWGSGGIGTTTATRRPFSSILFGMPSARSGLVRRNRPPRQNSGMVKRQVEKKSYHVLAATCPITRLTGTQPFLMAVNTRRLALYHYCGTLKA